VTTDALLSELYGEHHRCCPVADSPVQLVLSSERPIDLVELEQLCDAVGWSRRPLRRVRKALEHSLLRVGLWRHDPWLPKLVGFARCTGDGVVEATVWDVAVHPHYQGNGLGKALMAYVLEQLVPALRARGLAVVVQDGWVDDLVDLFNGATVVLYDSADHWRCSGVSEGFGLPPLEALACGCVLFSSFNHALADSLEPGTMAHQIGAGTLAADVERIAAAVADPVAWLPPPRQLEELLGELSEPRLRERWRQALEAINAHLDRLQAGEAPLRAPSLLELRARRWRQRLSKRLPAGLARHLA